jgi:hypothetical protein
MASTSSPALRASRRKGRNAALRGVPRTDNPFFAKNSVASLDELHGWSRVHAQEWLNGWEEAINDPRAQPWIESKLQRDKMGT